MCVCLLLCFPSLVETRKRHKAMRASADKQAQRSHAHSQIGLPREKGCVPSYKTGGSRHQRGRQPRAAVQTVARRCGGPAVRGGNSHCAQSPGVRIHLRPTGCRDCRIRYRSSQTRPAGPSYPPTFSPSKHLPMCSSSLAHSRGSGHKGLREHLTALVFAGNVVSITVACRRCSSARRLSSRDWSALARAAHPLLPSAAPHYSSRAISARFARHSVKRSGEDGCSTTVFDA